MPAGVCVFISNKSILHIEHYERAPRFAGWLSTVTAGTFVTESAHDLHAPPHTDFSEQSRQRT